MPELTSKPLELLITATNRSPQAPYMQTTAWAADVLRQAIPEADANVAPGGVMVAHVPMTTPVQRVQDVLGGNFMVAANTALEY